MALTFTKRFALSIGNRKFVGYDITHDGSETSIDASDIELNYVEMAMAGQVNGDETTSTAEMTTQYGSSVAFTSLSSGAVTSLFAVGY